MAGRRGARGGEGGALRKGGPALAGSGVGTAGRGSAGQRWLGAARAGAMWLGQPGRIRLSAPTRPFAERRIREALGKGGNFVECPDPAVGKFFFEMPLPSAPMKALGKEEIF